MAKRLGAWLTDRWPFVPVWKAVMVEDIPGGSSYFYSLGSAVLFVFIIQAVTGVFQVFYYVPTVDHAYDSINYLRTQIPLGWLIHGLHYWGAQAMVVLAAIHLSQVFIWGAHKKPREFTWLLGVSNLLLILAMSFTGAALPWDVKGFWATEVGTSIAGTVPLIGDFIKRLLRGAEDMGQLALDRMFATHILVVPLLLAGSVLIHLVAFRRKHAAGPWSERKRRTTTGVFWPDQLLKDVILSCVVLVVLLVLCAWSPAPTTGPADASDLSVQPKPEWNFLFLYQFIKAFKGPFEPVGTVLFPLAAVVFLFLVPFLTRTQERDPLRRPLGMGLFLAAWAAIVALTVSGALSHPGQGPSAASSKVAPAGGPAPKAGGQAGASEGSSLFQSMGCGDCHKVNGRGGAVGPDLSNEGSAGRGESWLAEQIKSPKSHNPRSIMPAFGSRLTAAEIQSLAAYLSELKGSRAGTTAEEKPAVKAPGSAGQVKPAAPKAAEEAAPSPGAPAKGSSQAMSQGVALFKSAGCIGCHKVNGPGGNVGPDLSEEGGKRTVEWLAQQIKDPKSHNSQSIMPAFGSKLEPAQIEALAGYLFSLKQAPEAGPAAKPSAPEEAKKEASEAEGAEVPPQPNVPQAEKTPGADALPETGPAAMMIGDAGHGAILFQQTCVRCHGPEGTDKVPNPGSDDGTVPPLNPIDPDLKSADPAVFASNIDLFIQHGSVPDGPKPALRMLPFGDSNTLTQQAISNLEAYVLSLNHVDRTRIMHPGIPPKIFVLATVFCFVVAGWILWLLVPIKRKTSPPPRP